MRDKTKMVGDIGEAHVLLELAKRDMKTKRVDLAFDLITSKGARIEVKTSSYQSYYKSKFKEVKQKWHFTFNNYDCDFIILVCLNQGESYSVNKFYIIPTREITKRKTQGIIINPEENKWVSKYESRWDLISK